MLPVASQGSCELAVTTLSAVAEECSFECLLEWTQITAETPAGP